MGRHKAGPYATGARRAAGLDDQNTGCPLMTDGSQVENHGT
jgi:hypothetical protein